MFHHGCKEYSPTKSKIASAEGLDPEYVNKNLDMELVYHLLSENLRKYNKIEGLTGNYRRIQKLKIKLFEHLHMLDKKI